MKELASGIMALNTIFLNYEGSEFCAGLLFGIHGSRLLIDLVRAITKQADAAMEV